MSTTRKELQEVLSRLDALEKKDGERSTMIQSLQSDNFSLLKELMAVQKQNTSLKETVDTLQQNSVQNDVTDLRQDNGLLKAKVATLETEVSKSKDLISDLQDKISNIEKENGPLETKMQSYTNEYNNKIKKTEDNLNQLRLVFNRGIVKAHDGLGPLKTNVTDLMTRTKALEDVASQKKRSVTDVQLNSSRELTTRKIVKLDQCVKMTKNGGDFDKTTCCLSSQTGGDMVISVTFIQEGEGELQILLKVEDGFYGAMGKTTFHRDMSSTTKAFGMKKGRKFWLEVSRKKGDAKIFWCILNSWLM